jgi:hypothetical protein
MAASDAFTSTATEILDEAPTIESPTPAGVAPSGELRFASREQLARLRGALEAARLMHVDVRDVGPGARGRLGEVVDDAIERTLTQRGAAPPGVGACCDRGDALADQLYRARLIGREGIALEIGALTGIVDARGALEPEDGEWLRFVRDATRDRPLVVLLDPANAAVRVYGAPRPLGEAIVEERTIAKVEPVTPVAATSTPSPAPTRTPTTPTTTPPTTRAGEPISEPPRSEERPRTTAEQLQQARSVLEAVTRATPLSGFEKAFVDGYAPVRAALLRGEVPQSQRAELRQRLAAFSTTFARVYAEALPTFASTGRHPRLVFELFDLAQKCARVHGARSTQVVIVDALRWDVGRELRARLGKLLSRKAVCVEEHALWSLLPTTTSVQLDALVRGADALKAKIVPERETAIVRGRSLDVLRRTRLGHRDALKLDLIEGKIREAGATEGERVEDLASLLSPILARAVSSAQQRSLVVIAGDHGFTFGDLDPEKPTSAARQGGATPEEVFVPFLAWLVSGVH